jgi:hypothetical protein
MEDEFLGIYAWNATIYTKKWRKTGLPSGYDPIIATPHNNLF